MQCICSKSSQIKTESLLLLCGCSDTFLRPNFLDILLQNLIVGSKTARTAKSIFSNKKHDILKSAKFFKSEVFESAKINLLISIYKTIYSLCIMELNWTYDRRKISVLEWVASFRICIYMQCRTYRYPILFIYLNM